MLSSKRWLSCNSSFLAGSFIGFFLVEASEDNFSKSRDFLLEIENGQGILHPISRLGYGDPWRSIRRDFSMICVEERSPPCQRVRPQSASASTVLMKSRPR